MATYPSDLKYTREHEWAKEDGDVVRIGVTSYAVEQLGDVTLVDLPPVGSEVQAQERFGDIESVKTVSELFAPISGEVVEVNSAIVDEPAKVNEDPQGAAWFVKIKASNPSELDDMMDEAAYKEFAESAS